MLTEEDGEMLAGANQRLEGLRGDVLNDVFIISRVLVVNQPLQDVFLAQQVSCLPNEKHCNIMAI